MDRTNVSRCTELKSYTISMFFIMTILGGEWQHHLSQLLDGPNQVQDVSTCLDD